MRWPHRGMADRVRTIPEQSKRTPGFYGQISRDSIAIAVGGRLRSSIVVAVPRLDPDLIRGAGPQEFAATRRLSSLLPAGGEKARMRGRPAKSGEDGLRHAVEIPIDISLAARTIRYPCACKNPVRWRSWRSSPSPFPLPASGERASPAMTPSGLGPPLGLRTYLTNSYRYSHLGNLQRFPNLRWATADSDADRDGVPARRPRPVEFPGCFWGRPPNILSDMMRRRG